MLGKVIIENGQKKIQALTADTGTGAPVGSYLYLEKKSNPQGYLYCDGSTFDETAYPALYQYLGTNVLPDWREFSAVGAEQNTTNVYDAQTNPSGVIHNHDVFTQGEFKDDQLQEHNHDVVRASQDFPASTSAWVLGETATSQHGNKEGVVDVTNARTGAVTRGKSRAVFIYIKATSGLTENQQENVLNTINENLSYSTEEHPTGAKWIDGKPIYRRVIEITNPAYDWTPIDLTNLFPNIAKGFLGKLCRITRQDGSIICQNGFYFADTDRCEFIIAEYTNNLRICCFLKSTAQITKIEFEVEYTKTTD